MRKVQLLLIVLLLGLTSIFTIEAAPRDHLCARRCNERFEDARRACRRLAGDAQRRCLEEARERHRACLRDCHD